MAYDAFPEAKIDWSKAIKPLPEPETAKLAAEKVQAALDTFVQQQLTATLSAQPLSLSPTSAYGMLNSLAAGHYFWDLARRADPMRVLMLLRAAKAKLAAGFTQRAGARDEHGVEVHHHDPRAVSFCSLGALHRAAGERLDYDGNLIEAAQEHLERVMGSSVPSFNDSRDRDTVLNAWDRAITLAEREVANKLGRVPAAEPPVMPPIMPTYIPRSMVQIVL